ncbi:hypothetical protein KSP39_PZI009011 [Platanthera zijinensis]|uniref:Polygalacturonase n=1 Tax=Platanthera zijinensis TaxID=2320716 RepID=A0AAP0G7G9_9ASPA
MNRLPLLLITSLILIAAAGDSTDWTGELVSAWTAACDSDSPATVIVPAGTFFVSSAVLMGPCRSSNIAVHIGGTIVAPASYTSQNRWIAFKNVSGLTVAGGLFDGQGQAVWNCKNAQNECPLGATSLSIENSNNVWLKGVSSVNSEMFHILIHRSRDVLVTGALISAASDSPNTDGIHIEESAGVTVRDGVIGTGDDCISIGPGAADVWIENIKCGPGHGISIGSLGSETMQNGVRNVTVMNIEFNGTENGFRIKTWAKPSDGFVEQVLFRNATMNAVKNPIIIDQHYCPRTTDCPTEACLHLYNGR